MSDNPSSDALEFSYDCRWPDCRVDLARLMDEFIIEILRKYGEPDIDKIRRAANLIQEESVKGNDHLAYLYAAWIKRHCEEILYEDLFRLELD